MIDKSRIENIPEVIECFDDAKKNKLDPDDKDLEAKFKELRNTYEGRQWNKIVTREANPKPTVNILAATVEQEVAMLSLPNPTVLAYPQEKTDLKSSKPIETVLQFVLKRNHLNMLEQMLIRDAIILGTGFVKVRWDPEGIRYKSKLKQAIGEIAIDPIDPVNVYPDPRAVLTKDWQYLHATYSRSKNYVEERYDVSLKSESEYDDIVVKESWYKPTKKYPQGRYVVWTDDSVLVNKENPYGFIPFYPLFNRKFSNYFWGEGEVESMYEIQQWLNVTLGYIINNAKYGSQFKLWTDDPNMKNKRINMNPKEMLSISKGSKVGVISHQGLDPAWFGLFKALQSTMQSVSGVHDVSYGTTSGGVTAASAIMALQESGKQRMALRQANIADMMQNMSLGIIKLMKQFYPDSRWYRILGNKEGIDFVKTDLSEYYDINVSFGNALPEDKMGKLNMAIAIAQMPPQNQQMLLSLLNDPTLTALMGEQSQLIALSSLVQQQQGQQGAAQGAAPKGASQQIPRGGNNAKSI